MRVVSGSARGRKLRAPDVETTRPITDRAKEGIFNMLGSLGGVEDLVVADLWAGSGSFGIECLSRGAERAVFVERGREALACLEGNITTLGFKDQARVIPAAVESALPGLGPVDLAFLDPPYADDPWPWLLEGLQADLIVGHAAHPIVLPDSWEEVRRRTYGRAHIVIARPQGTADDSAPSVVIAAEDPGAADVAALIEIHLAAAREASPACHAHALEVESLRESAVQFFAARSDGELMAVGALRLLGEGRAEIKSMHTAEAARGRGMGRAILRHLLAEAEARSISWVGLETGTMDAFAPARALYLSEGFVPCPPFADYTENPYSVCMMRQLQPDG